MSRVAVLDLGTNTFHILIVDIKGATFQKVYQERIFTKLGAEGITKIGTASYGRGIKALEHFSKMITDHQVDHTKALGTAALRNASNGLPFIKEVFDKTGIRIQVIDGLIEADYIYKGVKLAIPFQTEPYIIMDIGGGSVEFIIADSHASVYRQSFKIGLSPLHNIADISDVATVDDVVQLHKWLASKLDDLYTAVLEYQPVRLVGSAGAFEVLVHMTGGSLDDNPWFTIEQETFSVLYVKVLRSSRREKLQMKGLPAERVDYISAAFVLIWHIIDTIQPKELLVSKYALKEGVLSEFLE